MKTAEEIIQALDICSNSTKYNTCEGCPYIRVTGCQMEMKDDAKNLLKSIVGSINEEHTEESTEQWTREKVLAEAKKCVCGNREHDYGGPEDSFQRIANLWTAYHGVEFTPCDVSIMMALLKVARLSNNPNHMDSWVDLAGYAACGGEIAGKESDHESK